MPKLILSSKAQHEKLIRNTIVLGLEKGPDFVRALMIPCIVSLAHVDQNSATSLLKTLTAIKDWRVRYLTCHSLDKVLAAHQIAARFPTNIFQSFFVQNFSEYLLDQAVEVRIAAIDALPRLASLVDQELFVEHVIPRLSHLATDTEPLVRAALAARLPQIVPKMGKKKFNEHFLSLVLAMLRDESLDVKSTFVEHFAPIFEVISPVSMIESLEPVLADLCKSVVWRNKKISLDFVLKVAQAGGKEAMRDSLISLMLDASKDAFECVRDYFVVIVARLKESVGEDWCVDKLMRDVERYLLLTRLESHAHFKFRVAYAKYAGRLWHLFSSDYSRRLLQSLLGLCNDRVANVKIVVAKQIKDIVSHAKFSSPVAAA